MPSRGWFVFAQFIGSSTFADLQQVTNHNAINLSLKSAEAQELLPGFTDSVVELRPINESKLIGYSLVRDLKGRPAFVLKTDLGRQLTMQGRIMADATLFQFFAVGALFLVVILVVVDRFALSRITRLSEQVLEIGDNPEGARVCLEGKDELSGLADCMNAMLQKLDCNARRLRESEERLRIHNDRLEETVLERTQQIEHQAFHDKLTGLPNRALFTDRLRIALEKAKRSGTGTAALFLDLDNFKLINDSLGHDMGDQLLIEAANRFAEAVRPGDTVARLGGDEFTVLLEDVESEEEAGAIAERLLLCLRKPISLGSRETFVGASVGVAFTRNPAIGDVALLKNADTAMYRAKANGKSSHVVFNESMLDHAIERLELETDLRKSMENRELLVHFQPLIDLQTGKLTGAEALARWVHPTRGFVPPSQFIPIAEDTGLIIPIGYWILEQACLRAKDWIVEFDEPGFMISVNLSGKQLQRDDVVDRVRATLELTGLSATNLKLEITESVLMEDRDDVISKMTGLKELGVHLALDDFGTGYSSLSTLRVFPIDTLKIDRAFISRLGSEDDAMAIVEAILGLARTMKMDVTGEGVETQAQSDLIRKLGCQTGQGYLYAKPLPAHEFSAQFSTSGTTEEQKRAA